MSTCPNLTTNNQQCNCTYSGCPRHGMCCACMHYHRKNDELPACYFSKAEEKSWDRSISHFIRSRSR